MAVSISSACIMCGACIDTCPHEALFLGDSQAEVIADKCVECGECIEVCPTDAITLPAGAGAASEESKAAEAVEEKAEEKTDSEEKKEEVAQKEEPKKPEVEIPESEHQGVWIFIEQRNGKVAPVSLELLGAGRKLADKLGVELAGVLLGNKVGHIVNTLYEFF